MAKIPRKTQKIFAGSASNTGQFGSFQAGTKIQSTDVAVLQALTAFDTGLNSATTGSQNVLPLEEDQALHYIETSQIAYILQEGIAEYDAGTTYFTNSIVKSPGTYQLYGSKTNNNLGNALTNTTYWQILSDVSSGGLVSYATTVGGTANAITLTTSSGSSTLTAGQTIIFIPTAPNTAAVTVAVNGGTAVNITKSGTTALVPNDILTSKAVMIIWDGTQFQLQAPPAFSHGADIASASTINLDTATGDLVNLTGTATITAITQREGRFKVLKCAAGITFTNNGSIIVPGGANYTTLANDIVTIITYAANIAYLQIIKSNGQAVVAPTAPKVGSSITGCLPTSITGTSTTASIAISAGLASDSTNAVNLTSAGYTWAITNGNAINGTDTGATLFNSFTYHMYLISGPSGTGTYLSGALAPGSVPTFPAGYNTYYRRIFSLNTNSSGTIVSGTPTEVEGGAMEYRLATVPQDVATTTLGTTRTLYTMTVPTGIKVRLNLRLYVSASAQAVIVSSPDEPAVVPTAYTGGASSPSFDVVNASGYGGNGFKVVTTNTSGQIAGQSNVASTALYVYNLGYIDFRRG